MEQVDPIYSDDFLRDLPDDSIDRVLALCDRYSEWLEDGGGHERLTKGHWLQQVDASPILQAVVKNANFPGKRLLSDLGYSDIQADSGLVTGNFRRVEQAVLRLKEARDLAEFHAAARSRADALIDDAIVYSFVSDDYDRLHVLVKTLRSLVGDSEDMDDRHRRRILGAIDRLEREIGTRVSTSDRLYGVCESIGGWISASSKQVWNNRDEVIDLVKKIAEIYASGRRRAGLPANGPDLQQLPSGSEASESGDDGG